MKIGIFGGTFDPPHIAHQILASVALAQFELDHILWVLTPYPPHKKLQKITSTETRTELVMLTIEDNPGFVLSRVDLDRKPPHYAVDTISILKKSAPSDKFYYLMGEDSLLDLGKWHQPKDFIAVCDGILVMNRDEKIDNASKIISDFPGIKNKLLYINSPLIQISSTDIRSRIKNGDEYRYFVPANVYQYIKTNNLYLD